MMLTSSPALSRPAVKEAPARICRPNVSIIHSQSARPLNKHVARAGFVGVDVHGKAPPSAPRGGDTEYGSVARRGRMEVIDQLYAKGARGLENAKLLLADDFLALEIGGVKAFNKQEYLAWLLELLSAVPDLTWDVSTTGGVDHEGYCLATVKISGRHTGAPLTFPGLGTVQPKNRAFVLAPETHKVLLRNGRVHGIVMVTRPGSGALALYEALSGQKVLATNSIDSLNMPPL